MYYIGIDDTDVIGTPGTGRCARRIAAILSTTCAIIGVTRHQLFVSPAVPYTSHNSRGHPLELAGVGLAATGDGGRFLLKGANRSTMGILDVGTLLNAGIDEITTLDGVSVCAGAVDTLGKPPRPAFRRGKAVLYVEYDAEHQTYLALKTD
jgi:hypothetical protein